MRHYLVDNNQYKLINSNSPINQGTHGQIYLAQDKKSNEKLAAKILGRPSQEKKYIVREIAILIQMRALTIIPFSGFSLNDFRGNQNITIFMPYQNNGSLIPTH